MSNMNSRFETFSFLPPLSPSQAQAQADYILSQGLIPVIEYTENANSTDTYWTLWPIVAPRSKNNRVNPEEMNASLLMMQIDACSRRNPYAFIRLSGYDKEQKSTEHAFIVKTPMEGN